MRYRRIVFSVIALSWVGITASIYAQPSGSGPSIGWQKRFGGSLGTLGYRIIRTSDGGLLLAGTTFSNDGDVSGNHGDQDVWIVKLDRSHQIEWQRCLGGSATEGVNCIIRTVDGGYVMAGASHSYDGDATGNHGRTDLWVVKLAHDGSVNWHKMFGGTGGDGAETIIQTRDGGYVAAGATESNNDGDVTGFHLGGAIQGSYYDDAWIVRLDSSGNLLWERTLGGTKIDQAWGIVQSDDGGFVFAGQTSSKDGDIASVRNHGGFDAWVLKLDSTGKEIVWQRTLGGSSDDGLGWIAKGPGGIYYLTGGSNSVDGDLAGAPPGSKIWLLALNDSGRLLWQRTTQLFGTAHVWSIIRLTDGGYALAGEIDSGRNNPPDYHGGNTDALIARIDSNGVLLWQKCYGSSADGDLAEGIIEDSDGGLLFTGQSTGVDGDLVGCPGRGSLWIVKLAPESSGVAPDSSGAGSGAASEITVSLAQGTLTVSSPCSMSRVVVYDVLGRAVASSEVRESRTASMDVSALPAGVYFVRVSCGSNVETKPFTTLR